MLHPPSHHPRRGFYDWIDLIINDHGFLRLFWHNRHEFSPDMWRSNQPAPQDIRKAKNLGIKTIVNLRGARDDGGWRLEKEACDRYGIILRDFTIRSRDIPSKDTINAAYELFKSAEKPILYHCKSGADRAGIMAALYLLLMKNASSYDALAMLSWRFLHVRQAKTGILDAFIDAYRVAEANGVDFLTWVNTEMDASAIKENFITKGWATRLVDDILKRE